MEAGSTYYVHVLIVESYCRPAHSHRHEGGAHRSRGIPKKHPTPMAQPYSRPRQTWCLNCKAIAPFIDTLDQEILPRRKILFVQHRHGARHQLRTLSRSDGDLRDSITGPKTKEIEKAIVENYDGKMVAE